MRAVVINDTSNRDSIRLQEVDDPTPADNEVIVDVKACGINFTDLLSLDGKYQNNPPPPFTPGKDAAGIVSAVGPGVTRHRVGDRVIAHVVHGGLAEKTRCSEGLCFSIPDGIEFDTAAALGLPYITAYFAIKVRGVLRPGEIVLINGATGGVGLACMGMAKALGAERVLAGLTTPSKAEGVKAVGAPDAIIDLSGDDLREGLRDQVAAATDGHGADLVIDMVGGEVFGSSLRAVAPNGRIVVVGFTSGTIPTLRTNYLLLKSISVIGSTLHYYMKHESPEFAEGQKLIFDLLLRGRIGPNIMDKFPFERFMDAIKLLEDRRIVGKAVVTMDGV